MFSFIAAGAGFSAFISLLIPPYVTEATGDVANAGVVMAIISLDVGVEAGTPVTDDYPARGNEFNGKINWVQVDLEPDDHSHLIDSDHRAHVRLTKQ
jgi:hypothetical protein